MNYYLQDVIPHGAEAYWHVLEQVNRAYFPVQILSLALGLALIGFIRLNPEIRRWVLVLLAIGWMWLGLVFFLEHYVRLNWLSGYIAPVCAVQATILIIYAIRIKSLRVQASKTGIGLLIYTVMIHPFWFLISGRGLYQIELIAMSPDATALATLGVAALLYPGGIALMVFPLFWLIASGAVLLTLNQPEGWVSIVAVVTVLVTWITRIPLKFTGSQTGRSK